MIAGFVMIAFAEPDISEELFLTIALVLTQGLYIALSIFNVPKYRYIGTYTLTLDSGEKVNYAIVRKTVNCHFIFLPFNLLSLAFYIPHEVKYYLVRDVGKVDSEYLNKRINPSFLMNVQETIRVKLKDLRKIQNDSPEHIEELKRRISESKKSFEANIKRFTDEGLIVPEEITPTYSIYTFTFTDAKLYTFYTRYCCMEDTDFVGFLVGKGFEEHIKNDFSNFFICFNGDDDIEGLRKLIFFLGDDGFDFLMKKKEEKDTDNM